MSNLIFKKRYVGVDVIFKMQIHEKTSIHNSLWVLYTFQLIDIICSLIDVYQTPTMWTGIVFDTGVTSVVKTDIVPALCYGGSMKVFMLKEGILILEDGFCHA